MKADMENLQPHGPKRFKPSRFDVTQESGQDSRLREEIFQLLKADPAIQVSGLEISVNAGAVGIFGKVASPEAGELIVAKIHKITGVSAVEDHLLIERISLEGPIKGIL